MSRRSLSLVALVALSVPQIASAAELLVTTDGMNGTLTMENALNEAQDGDTLILLPGTYEPVSFEGRSLSLIADAEPGQVVLTGVAVKGGSEVYIDNVMLTNLEGAIHVDDSRLTLAESTIQGDLAVTGGTVLDAVGGATVDLIEVTVKDFVSEGSVALFENSTLNASGLRLSNLHSLSGSPLLAIESDLSISDSVFADTTSEGSGGVIGMEGGSLEMYLSQFNMAYSAGAGAHLYLNSVASVTLVDTDFLQGYSEVAGGSIYMDNVADARMGGCRFSANSSGTGGALSVRGKTMLRTKDVEFFENNAEMGGHIATSGATLDMTRTWLYHGQATWGSGVYMNGGKVRMTNVGAVKGTGAKAGGAFLQTGGSLDLRFAVLEGNEGKNGAAVLSTAGTTSLTGAIVASNPMGIALEARDSAAITIRQSLLVDDDSDPTSGNVTIGRNVLAAGPIFLDPANNAYMLSTASPAIDAMVSCTGTDLDGTTCDMGMFGGPSAWALPDADEDGYTFGRDCNDNSAAVNESMEEVPNDGVDQNCDGSDAAAN